jgi:PhnB protein
MSIAGLLLRRVCVGPPKRPATIATTDPKEPAMTQAIPYLGYDGNCAAAMRFYETTLKGRLEVLMSGADSPMAEQMPKEFADRIIHARLVLPGGGTLYAGDCPVGMPYEGIKGVSITLDYADEQEAGQIFNALAAGGQVTMPMQPAFWAKSWGMCIDKFGLAWIVNGAPIEIPARH